jgi:hypothetical protein|tara:strand:+ start:4513 stop:4710 length:198 start_codon:yes stop_codon:yes gene_type:complete
MITLDPHQNSIQAITRSGNLNIQDSVGTKSPKALRDRQNIHHSSMRKVWLPAESVRRIGINAAGE